MKTTEQRFWTKVIKTESCWLWFGSKDKDGYGQILSEGKLQGAHRVSYGFINGSIPKGLLVLHTCDKPSCVNPEHLFTGTHQDNFDDMVRKNRRVVESQHDYCENGHAMSGDNLRIKSNGQRVCRTCHRAYALKSYHRATTTDTVTSPKQGKARRI